jgi:NADH:ubiquinone oxidoreductase subunit F (NADH-binding)
VTDWGTRPDGVDGDGPGRSQRLLLGLRADRRPLSLEEHVEVHGPLPVITGRGGPERALVDLVEGAGLVGRGGAAFPVAAKMRAVLDERPAGDGRRVAHNHRRAVVVANGCEGEPASGKDRVLLAYLPHLVLDGAVAAAAAVGADRVIVVVHEDVVPQVRGAMAERAAAAVDPVSLECAVVADRFIAGQESALVSSLNGGAGLPTLVPPRPFERGVDRRPTLIHNVETLAHLALAARHGPSWYRRLGTPAEPGTTLVTVRGVVREPGVYEISRGTPVGQLLGRAGGLVAPLQALLIGGYAGAWVGAEALGVGLSEAALRTVGGTLGAGVVIVAGADNCGVATTARILSYLAAETAGQCGPCVHGLAAMADTMTRLAVGEARRDSVERLHAWAWQVTGRGACHHPDGAARLASSALEVFAADVDEHRHGRPCSAALRPTWTEDDLPGTAAFAPRRSPRSRSRSRP